MTAQQRTLAERVAEDLRADASAQGDALAEFVLAADDARPAPFTSMSEEVVAQARYDAALAALAKALGIKEGA